MFNEFNEAVGQLEGVESLFQDPVPAQLGDVEIIDGILNFWNGMKWEQVLNFEGVPFKIESDEEKRVFEEFKEDPYGGMLAALELDMAKCTREEVLSFLLQSTLESNALMEELDETSKYLSEYILTGLEPEEVETLADKHCVLLQQHNEVIAERNSLERGLKEVYEEACTGLNSFTKLLSNMKDNATWQNLSDRGWKMVAVSPNTYADMKSLYNRDEGAKHVLEEAGNDEDFSFFFTNSDEN